MPSSSPRLAVFSAVASCVLMSGCGVAASTTPSAQADSQSVAASATTQSSSGASAAPSSASVGISPSSSAPSPAATTATSAPSSTASPKPTAATGYTLAAVAQHASASSCWTVVKGVVYDLTAWVNKHPGGASPIKGLCGHDGTAALFAEHGSGKPDTLALFKLGPLAG